MGQTQRTVPALTEFTVGDQQTGSDIKINYRTLWIRVVSVHTLSGRMSEKASQKRKMTFIHKIKEQVRRISQVKKRGGKCSL